MSTNIIFIASLQEHNHGSYLVYAFHPRSPPSPVSQVHPHRPL